MSYCRFSDGDVYMFDHVYGGIECCACRLAPFVPTIFTKGTDRPFLGQRVEPCEHCGGEGCKACMMHGSINFSTRSEALAHLLEHREAGHEVPDYAIEAMRRGLEEYGETKGIVE